MTMLCKSAQSSVPFVHSNNYDDQFIIFNDSATKVHHLSVIVSFSGVICCNLKVFEFGTVEALIVGRWLLFGPLVRGLTPDCPCW